MSTTEVPFSTLLQRPKDTLAKLENSHDHRLRLARRDGDDLILESAAQADAKNSAWSTTTRLFMSLIKHDEGARAILLALPDVFPWVRFLPREDVQAFVIELVEVANACAELDTLAPLEAVVSAWRVTANAHADPELRAALLSSSEGEDHGAVTRPGDE